MRHDAIVIGGGPAGATAALLLARAGWSVAVVERDEFPRRKVCGEFLSAAALPLLRELGLAEAFLDLAGPPIRRVGVFAGNHAVTADMPRLGDDPHGWGHALGREHLDTLLLQRAAAAGATVWQPVRAAAIQGAPGAGLRSVITPAFELRAPVVIAAHGSWDQGSLSTQPSRPVPRPTDLFAFKARFAGSHLASGLMPLLTFPGGYGGMVHTDHDRVSLSCCVRRDQLVRCRGEHPGLPAGAAVTAHIVRHCDPVRAALQGASLEPRSSRSAGPIRPGIRTTRRAGVFLIGNAAGEAHPVVAEGISMAIQSGWLLARCLIAGRGDDYAREWRQAFSWRIRAAAALAHWAMRPDAVAVTLPLLRAFPQVLTEAARTTGKVSAPAGRGAYGTSVAMVQREEETHAVDAGRQG